MAKVISWSEKPEYQPKINIGCCNVEPEVLRLIPKNKPYGMDNVIRKMLTKKRKLQVSYQEKDYRYW